LRAALLSRLDEPEVLRFVALAVSTSVRELEGALNRVLAWSAVSGRPASVELARDALRGVCF
jgi:chromosomal replication initiator protein